MMAKAFTALVLFFCSRLRGGPKSRAAAEAAAEAAAAAKVPRIPAAAALRAKAGETRNSGGPYFSPAKSCWMTAPNPTNK